MHGWPSVFLERMQSRLKGDYEIFLESLSTDAPVSIRSNPFKKINLFEKTVPVPWCDEGLYLSERPSFTFDPLFHAGCYYVQEASSMFIEQVFKEYFKDDKPLKILDLCAAPGGKSTHLLSLMPEGSILVSNEMHPLRNKILRENIIKWGRPDVLVTQSSAEDFLQLSGYFDLVLVDAPCSGEGLFRRDPAAANEWSEAAVTACSLRQNRILDHAAELIRPGGLLIYSTCTFEESENEDQMRRLLANDSFEEYKLNRQFAGIRPASHGLQFYPHEVRGEGFYVCALTRKSGKTFSLREDKTPAKRKAPLSIVSEYLEQPDAFIAVQKTERLYAVPAHVWPLFSFMESRFYIRQAGVYIGDMKGTAIQPAHDLALSLALKRDKVKFEFGLEDAIKYLRCESVIVSPAEKGWVLGAYKGYPLGWMKVLDNRMNNYFPKQWRIRKVTANT